MDYIKRLNNYAEMLHDIDNLMFLGTDRKRDYNRLNSLFRDLKIRMEKLIPDKKGISIFKNGVKISEQEYKEKLIND